jgi:hypothetical protein
VAGGRVVSVLVPLSVGVLLVGGFIFLFSLLVLGWFVRFSLWGRGGQWGTGIFCGGGRKFFRVYTPHLRPSQRTYSNSTFSTTFNKKYIAKKWYQ